SPTPAGPTSPPSPPTPQPSRAPPACAPPDARRSEHGAEDVERPQAAVDVLGELALDDELEDGEGVGVEPETGVEVGVAGGDDAEHLDDAHRALDAAGVRRRAAVAEQAAGGGAEHRGAFGQ